MREFTIHKNDADQRLDRFLLKAVPLLPASLAQKYIRLKRIKVNGARAERDYRLREGDRLQLYLNDEFFEAPSEENVYLTIANPKLHILYEDENILLLDKPAGLVVHADEGEKVNTLVNHMLAYLYQKREWKPREAKNAEALRVLNEKIRERELSKFYLCICLGRPEPPKGRIECFLRKDSKTNTVRVYHHPVPDGRSAVTLYETLETRDRLSLVEVELLTGRTHQIRASFADMGHPLLGDGKYGVGSVNRRYGEAQQALYSYRLRFDFPTDAGILNYLRGREFIADEVPFRRKYFG